MPSPLPINSHQLAYTKRAAASACCYHNNVLPTCSSQQHVEMQGATWGKCKANDDFQLRSLSSLQKVVTCPASPEWPDVLGDENTMEVWYVKWHILDLISAVQYWWLWRAFVVKSMPICFFCVNIWELATTIRAGRFATTVRIHMLAVWCSTMSHKTKLKVQVFGNRGQADIVLND